MKKNVYSYLLGLSILLAVASCKNGASDSLKSFIPGTFVRGINNEFTTGSDSLVISVLDEGGGTYLVSHRSGYQQRIDGKLLPPGYKTEKWTATYDQEHHQLQVQPQGKTFTFLPEKGILVTNGGTEFKKVQ